MAQTLRTYIQDVERARKALNKKGQLDSQKERDGLRELVETYFGVIRPLLISDEKQGQAIKTVDDLMQELLVLCHKRGRARRYQEMLNTIKASLVQLDGRNVAITREDAEEGKIDDADRHITETLQAIVPSAALSYGQAISDILSGERLSWRGPAADLREALRETLDYLAPDEEVKAMPGYKQEAGTSGPTMKQKVRYILKNRGASKAVSGTTEDAADAVEEALGSFVRSVYTRSSVSTHTPTDKSEVLRVRDLVRVVLCELLEIHSHK